MPVTPVPPLNEHNIHPLLRKYYQKLAEMGSSYCRGYGPGKEAGAFAFAAMQQIFGVFGLVATMELWNCPDLPESYKITCTIAACLAMSMGSYQQWQKCRGKYIPGVYTDEHLPEPPGLSKFLGKISAMFEVLSVVFAGANFVQLFTSSISETGMTCVKDYFLSANPGLLRLNGAIAAAILMGPQMWAYYHQHAVVNYPYLTSAGYTLGSYFATAFPMILQMTRDMGNMSQNIAWLVIGFFAQIPKVPMLAEQHKHREREPLRLLNGESETAPLLPTSNHHPNLNRKAIISVFASVAQAGLNMQGLTSMAKVVHPQEDILQQVLIVFAILLAVLGIIVSLGRFLVYLP